MIKSRRGRSYLRCIVAANEERCLAGVNDVQIMDENVGKNNALVSLDSIIQKIRSHPLST